MLQVNDALFKAYDIRGVYGRDLDDETAEAVGYAFGRYIGKGKKVVVGLDVRLSSESLMRSMLNGMSRTGLKIFNVGMVPTPAIYFVIRHFGMDGGAMVTASHNPKEWNGFKLFGSGGRVIGLDSGLREIKDLMLRGGPERGDGIEGMEDIREKAISAYEAFLLGKTHVGKTLKICIDPGNGCYSGMAKDILKKAGMEVIAINDMPDGSFPARAPEPKEESIGKLMNTVVEKRLDFGVAFDSDGDRAIFVDDKGRFLRGDVAYSVFIDALLGKGEKAVYEVSCSRMVEDAISKRGGVPMLSRTGRAFILEMMVKESARIGGEISGHTYFSEVYNADDALYAAMKMAEILSSGDRKLSEIVDSLPKYYTSAIELDIEEERKYLVSDIIRKMLLREGKKVITVDGARVEAEDGWFLIRPSNTSPKMRLIAESGSAEGLRRIVAIGMEVFEKAKKDAERR